VRSTYSHLLNSQSALPPPISPYPRLSFYLFHILLPRNFINQIKKHLHTKPPGLIRARHTTTIFRLLIRNLIRLAPAALGRRIGQQLRMAALVQYVKLLRGFLNRFADGEKAVVAQESGFLNI
jgi:hypothetical protein